MHFLLSGLCYPLMFPSMCCYHGDRDAQKKNPAHWKVGADDIHLLEHVHLKGLRQWDLLKTVASRAPAPVFDLPSVHWLEGRFERIVNALTRHCEVAVAASPNKRTLTQVSIEFLDLGFVLSAIIDL
jgi:hypothetical protein